MLSKVKWLQQPNVSHTWALTSVLIWVGLLFAFQDTQIASDVDNKISLPSYFRLRHELSKGPELHKKIKVFGVDDSTVSWLKSPNLTMEQWSQLLLDIDRRKPKAIIIDAMFSIANIPSDRVAESQQAIEAMSAIESRVIVGAFAAPKVVPFRQKISLDNPAYELKNYIHLPENLYSDPEKVARSLNLYPARGGHIYGPDPVLRPYFKHVGQILYSGNSRFIPFLRIDDTTAIPHFMIFADDEPKFYKGKLYLRKAKISTYEDGTAPINFNSFRYYLGKTTALRFLMEDRYKEKYLNLVNEGDYVYIIPAFYTGNTDFKQTPFGPMPAGYTHLSVLNSILNQDWLVPINYKRTFIVIAACLGAALAVKVNSIGFALSIVVGLSAWVSIAMYLFAFKGLLVPLVFPAISFIGPLITIFVEKSRVAEKKSQYIRNALEGSIRPRELETLAREPNRVNFEARERVVTVMFIDVVGFSLLAENQLPRIAFDSLKQTLSEISRIVHEYGGIVNKNLGDGLLCFFGYSLERDETTFDHAEKALECAIKIQKENVPKMLAAAEKKEPVHPLRIGINTSSVYLGNLGTENRIDFTVVGNGVNFAKRLEGACEPHSVLMGGTTRELVEPLGIYQDGLKKRLIEIKHHHEMVESWEYDPYWDELEMRVAANNAYRSSTHQARAEKRWRVDLPDNLIVTTNMGTGELVNFSSTGLSIKLPSLLVKGAVLTLNLDSSDGRLKKKLEAQGLGTISIEVRWGFQDNKGYLHGVRFRHVTTEQTMFVVEQLCKFGLAGQAWQKSGSPDDQAS
ncbi:adenylate/guanylate cyclase domain-containing protein [Pseudobacteriovorax antillogorgiicola]|uniref:Adenylate cyclase, class 3 n=1 Tax=Pseudobacteriovorax antillogorgiicola TaxID=1513793 RepID=A0A1Y6CBG9_9BACT|nr:adenylate/guanylate cyclase domain-containing protein [Pseudobacteriovorax antillogorgiicola]TCS48612.1 class 3 adenylate cyclase [Pseudobacteriovorax antillogorgiicola]SMF55493.1 Adenylate cyclase, class 3 [Pseudobacteriovorax antillogorgiicola]